MTAQSPMEEIATTLEKLVRFAPAFPFTANQIERIANTFEKEAPRLVDQVERLVDVMEVLSKEYKQETVDKLLGEAVGFLNGLADPTGNPK